VRDRDHNRARLGCRGRRAARRERRRLFGKGRSGGGGGGAGCGRARRCSGMFHVRRRKCSGMFHRRRGGALARPPDCAGLCRNVPKCAGMCHAREKCETKPTVYRAREVLLGRDPKPRRSRPAWARSHPMASSDAPKCTRVHHAHAEMTKRTPFPRRLRYPRCVSGLRGVARAEARAASGSSLTWVDVG
jgi:hypothetical protein